jgi:putative ABC transport system permease protein
VIAVTDELKMPSRTRGLAIDFYTTSVKLEERGYVDNQFGTVVSMLLGLAMLVATVGAIGLMGSLGISVWSGGGRSASCALLAPAPGPSWPSLTMEGMLQGVMSWLVAMPLSFVLAQPLARALGQTMIEVDLDYAYNFPAVFVWLAAVLIISVLASILPARDAIRVSVRESLAYG